MASTAPRPVTAVMRTHDGCHRYAQPDNSSNDNLQVQLTSLGEAREIQGKISEGEALILGSDGRGGVTLVARVKINEWPELDN